MRLRTATAIATAGALLLGAPAVPGTAPAGGQQLCATDDTPATTMLPARNTPGFFYVDLQGDTVLDPDVLTARRFKDGLAVAYAGGGGVGFIDRTGAWAIEPQWDVAWPFFEDRALVSRRAGYGFLHGFIDRAGREVIPLRYSDLDFYHEGRAAVKIDGKWGFLDGDGRLAVAPRYDHVQHFAHGLAAVATGRNRDARYAYINRNGTPVTAFTFEYAAPFNEGVASVRVDGRYGYLSPDGTWAIEPRFDFAGQFREGLAAVEEDGRWGFIDHDGSYVIPPRWEHAGEFADGRAVVLIDGLYGYIDRSGALVIPARFIEYERFCAGAAWVATEDRYGYIDRDGDWIFVPEP